MAAGRELPTPRPEAFPALRRVGLRPHHRHVPFVRQLEAADCGAACLTMVLHFYGRELRLEEVRQVTGAGRDAASAFGILQAAEWFGMRGRGLRVGLDDLSHLPRGAILHWGFNHFVVYEGHSRRAVTIVDPASGRRRVPMDKFSRQFTGVALTLEPAETFERRPRGKSRIWVHLGKLFRERGVFTRILVTSVLLRVLALALPILTGLVVDRVVPRADLPLLQVVAIGIAGLLAFQLIAQLVRAHLLLKMRTSLDTSMTLGFLDYLVELPYAFFQRRYAGDLMMRVNSNAAIRELMSTHMLSGLLDGLLVAVYLIVLFFMNIPLAVLVLGLGTAQVVLYLVARRRYHALTGEALEAQARSQSYLVQLVGGVETLKAVGGEHRAVEHWSNLFVDEVNADLKRGRAAAYVDALTELIRIGSPLVILGIGAAMVVQERMSLGAMLALAALAAGFLIPLGTLVQSGLQLQALRGYIERIDDILLAEPEQERARVRPAPRLRGRVSIENVSYRYDPRSPYVVRDVSLEIEPGKAIAIVGRSGSGKSTLAGLLVGLYQPTEGRVLYDGQPLLDLDLRSVRRQLGIVPQRPFIFGTSVRANIALVDPALPLERVVEAARLACLHDEIEQLAPGYETLLSEGGSSLSGGQRQRLALARALVHRPPILLLDEATSHLDTETEARVMHNLDGLRATRIVIAHRLSTIAAADLILVMDQGRIVERGTHQDLLAQRGVYRDLVAAQTAIGERPARMP